MFGIFIFCLGSLATYPEFSETTQDYILANRRMQVNISKKSGIVSKIFVEKQNILEGECDVSFSANIHDEKSAVISVGRPIKDSFSLSIKLTTECLTGIAVYTYTLDTAALLWEVELNHSEPNLSEGYVSFSLPIVPNVEKTYTYGNDEPIKPARNQRTEIVYREDSYVPMISGYSRSNGYGFSIVAPFDRPKPGLRFIIDDRDWVISLSHLRPDSNNIISVSVYLISHEADWRPALGFALIKYPEYFYPVETSEKHYGWFHLTYPNLSETQIRDLKNQGVEWIAFTEYFPFYGKYIPSKPDWSVIIHSDDLSLHQWEKGAGTHRNNIQAMKNYISLWQKYDVQVYLYYQSAEAWYQYANQYFPEDIATDMKGNPIPSYLFTHLMNPDPKGRWGYYILDQAREILATFPEIDGIFYDRVDYAAYDFAHDDGLTMIEGRPVYMLAFGQEKINEAISDIYQSKRKAIWGNVPTSVEACKNLDGIMAEKNLRYLKRLQYLGLVKPIVYLPYDGIPEATENKLKDALLYGATISVTYGGLTEERLESKYKHIFDLLRNRSWVLNAFCFELPDELVGNLYRTPDSNYVLIIISPEKFQVRNHPFDYNKPITVRIPDTREIDHAYVLSGDWRGVSEINFQKENHSLKINLPFHLASSAIYLTREKEYDLVRLSPPTLTRNRYNKITFLIDNTFHQSTIELRTPWEQQSLIAESDTITFSIYVPDKAKGENEILVCAKGVNYFFTSWVVEPVSIVPKERIFIHHREGENIPFYISNNLATPLKVAAYGTFAEGEGSIVVPKMINLSDHETRIVNMHITAQTAGTARIIVSYDSIDIAVNERVYACLAFAGDATFHEDFSSGLDRWITRTGTWNTSKQTAHASGVAHFAYINSDWENYIFEATVRCQGSSNPNVDWLKSYIFFRLQDENNYYRYGIQGETGVLSLYKRIDGQWRQLRTAPFTPEKNKWYTLRVQVDGDRITCFIDNQRIMALNDSSFRHGGIGLGVLEDSQKCEYKNIYVKEIKR